MLWYLCQNVKFLTYCIRALFTALSDKKSCVITIVDLTSEHVPMSPHHGNFLST